MKALVIGAGSIGKRHIRNLLELGIKSDHISVVDTREDRLSEAEHILKDGGLFQSIDEALVNNNYNIGFICSPTSMHIEHAIILADKKVNLCIEKPLCKDLENVERLTKLVDDNNLIVLMAYVFRHSLLTKKVEDIIENGTIGKIYSFRGEFSEYLPDWHPWEDYRTFYMASKKQGGGSILDQCHIMDLAHYFVGEFASNLSPRICYLSFKNLHDDCHCVIFEFHF